MDSDANSSESDLDDNAPEKTESSNQNGNTMQSSSATIMTGSNFSYDTDAMCEKQSDDDNLENLRRKVSSLIVETASTTSTTSSSNTTIINKKYNSKNSENNNNNIEDSDDDEFYDEKKFNYSARIKRFVEIFLG